MAGFLLFTRIMIPSTAPAFLPARWLALPLLAAVALFTVGCAGGPGHYTYEYIPGRTATVNRNGTANVPLGAPAVVAAGIEAGNRIVGLPYVYGGGHGDDGAGGGGFDCSGTASYVLRAMGRLHGTLTSEEFRDYGESGPGRWVSVWARHGHVFLVVAGLRFDTGYTGGYGNTGPRWSERDRPADGCVLRHPAGL